MVVAKIALGAVASIAVGSAVAAVVVRRRWIVVTVVGDSMVPALRDGDRVLARRASAAPARDDVVVLAAPWQVAFAARWNVKRVAALPGDAVPAVARAAVGSDIVPAGSLVVLGDNRTASNDSREFGLYPLGGVLGVVVRRLSSPGAA